LKLIWITGAGGLIGSYLQRSVGEHLPGVEAVGLVRQDAAGTGGLQRHERLDLTDFRSVENLFRTQRPELVVHCAAMSKTPDCEANPKLAWKINMEATSFLAELAEDIAFVFFSSDLVFDGEQGSYDESATPGPLNVYAETKAAAEQVVLANARHTVVRTSLNGGVSPSGERGFNEQLRIAFQRGEDLKLFVDEYRSPIAVKVTAQAVWELVKCGKPGLYHIGGSERLSRYDIGRLIASRYPELNPRIEAVSRKDFESMRRPRDTSLNCGKIQSLLGMRLPGLGEWLAAHPEEDF
jgi:dTDP-4-dehydrorhamnose reductase